MNPNHTSLRPSSATPFLTQDTCTLRASLGQARPLVDIGSVISAYKIAEKDPTVARALPQVRTPVPDEHRY